MPGDRRPLLAGEEVRAEFLRMIGHEFQTIIAPAAGLRMRTEAALGTDHEAAVRGEVRQVAGAQQSPRAREQRLRPGARALAAASSPMIGW